MARKKRRKSTRVRVKGHTRRVKGKRVRVKGHSRKK